MCSVTSYFQCQQIKVYENNIRCYLKVQIDCHFVPRFTSKMLDICTFFHYLDYNSQFSKIKNCLSNMLLTCSDISWNTRICYNLNTGLKGIVKVHHSYKKENLVLSQERLFGEEREDVEGIIS